MPDDDKPAMTPANLSIASDQQGALQELIGTLPAAMQIMLDPRLTTQVKEIARLMSTADGFTPRHLIDKPSACFAVVTRAIGWRLDPYFVAMNTYQTPGGAIGFMGKLCQAILEQSGRMVGPIEYEHTGDWGIVTGMFELKAGAKGGEYPSPTWKREKEGKLLGVIVRGTVRGESKPRVWPGEGKPFMLSQCYPLNSPLWATDPATQICYLAVRRFGDIAVPGVYGGVPFSVDDLVEASELARDITPDIPARRSSRKQAAAGSEPEAKQPATVIDEGSELPWSVTDNDGVVHDEFNTAEGAAKAVEVIFRDAAKRGEAGLAAAWENNQELVESIREGGKADLADELETLLQELSQSATDAPGKAPEAPAKTEEAKPAPEPKRQRASKPIPTAESQPAQSADPAENQPASGDTGEPTSAEVGEHLADEATAAAPPAPPPASVDPWWDKLNLAIPLPTRGAAKASDWPGFCGNIGLIASKAPSIGLLDKLLADNKKNMISSKLFSRQTWDEMDNKVHARRVELEQAQ
jgi:hypothetical protein